MKPYLITALLTALGIMAVFAALLYIDPGNHGTSPWDLANPVVAPK